MVNPAYVSITDAAERLNVHPDTVRRMIYAQKLPSVRVGRLVRIPLEALTLEALQD